MLELASSPFGDQAREDFFRVDSVNASTHVCRIALEYHQRCGAGRICCRKKRRRRQRAAEHEEDGLAAT
ncbi:hypothetical protein A5791_02305 [Mycobacterium sp. 852002-51163_SCH5372311]|nr:hypothetical protein A5791_02305 [Mycobacterium sp. 852002-51163_SCH5372311]